MKRLVRIILSASLVIAGFLLLFILAVYTGLFGKLKSITELQDYKNATASEVLSEEGKVLGYFFSENRTNVTFGQIPEHVIDALIATEDVRFYQHKGIDTKSLFRVLIKTVLFSNRSSGGGSTITQQLAKNMFGRTGTSIPSILINKTKEAILANRIEKIFTKEEILTLYLNTISFGENVYGIGAASIRYFNKEVDSLKTEEGAVLIGMLKANTYYNPRLNPANATLRRNVVIDQMEKYNFLDASKADSIKDLPLIIKYTNYESGGPADYFLYQVKKDAAIILNRLDSINGTSWNINEDGLVIKTTLNLTLQEYATSSFHDHLSKMQNKLRDQYKTTSGRKFLQNLTKNELKMLNLTDKRDEIRLQRVFDWDGFYTDSISVTDSLMHSITLLHAGLIAIDPVTGGIKSWVGGIDFQTFPYDQVLARRQLASTFKPIVYAAALEDGVDPCTYLDNDSIILTGLDEEWTPENFDHTYGGKYSFSGALIHSMNVPTFNLYMNLGFSRVDSLWRKMGFSYPLDNTPSLPLGTAEANLREVAIAYASFTNGGYKIEPYSITSIETSGGEVLWQKQNNKPVQKVISQRTSKLMSYILQRAVIEGTGSSLRSAYDVALPLAGKTGTSQNYSDAWFAAFNPKLVMVSRVGASSPVIHFNNGTDGSGSALALPLVALTLKKVQEDPQLKKDLIEPFPGLNPDLQAALDCADFKEDDFLDKFLDIFKKDEFQYKEKELKPQRKRSFLRRLFRR